MNFAFGRSPHNTDNSFGLQRWFLPDISWDLSISNCYAVVKMYPFLVASNGSNAKKSSLSSGECKIEYTSICRFLSFWVSSCEINLSTVFIFSNSFQKPMDGRSRCSKLSWKFCRVLSKNELWSAFKTELDSFLAFQFQESQHLKEIFETIPFRIDQCISSHHITHTSFIKHKTHSHHSILASDHPRP